MMVPLVTIVIYLITESTGSKVHLAQLSLTATLQARDSRKTKSQIKRFTTPKLPSGFYPIAEPPQGHHSIWGLYVEAVQ